MNSAHTLIALVVAATACSSSSPQAAAPVTAAVQPVAPGVQLELGELKLVDVHKQKAIEIHADGRIEYAGNSVMTVTRGGTIVANKDGEIMFALQPDGSILGPGGKPLDMTLAPDGTLTAKNQTITVDDSGLVVGGNSNAPPMRVEGATTPGLERTALFVLVAATMPRKLVPAPEVRASP